LSRTLKSTEKAVFFRVFLSTCQVAFRLSLSQENSQNRRLWAKVWAKVFSMPIGSRGGQDREGSPFRNQRRKIGNRGGQVTKAGMGVTAS
jgi:hypothetical protein